MTKDRGNNITISALVIFIGIFALFVFAGQRLLVIAFKSNVLLQQSANIVGFIDYANGINQDSNTKKVGYTRDPFANITLRAKAAVVFDIRSQRPLFSYNADRVLPLASLTKIMTSIVALESLPKETVVVVQRDDIAQEGDSGLLVGERWRLADLLRYTLTTSSNDGASAIAATAGSVGQVAYGFDAEEAKHLFLEKMNQKSSELRLIHTQFFNETGLDTDAEKSGGYGTAQEVARMLAYAFKNNPEIFTATAADSFTVLSLDGVAHSAKNTNTSLGGMPGVIVSKTGFTDLAGGNLAVIADLGIDHPVAIVVLGSTFDGRFEDVEKLLWTTLEYFKVNGRR